MAGATIDVTCNLKADVGYRYRHVQGGDMFGYARMAVPASTRASTCTRHVWVPAIPSAAAQRLTSRKNHHRRRSSTSKTSSQHKGRQECIRAAFSYDLIEAAGSELALHEELVHRPMTATVGGKKERAAGPEQRGQFRLRLHLFEELAATIHQPFGGFRGEERAAAFNAATPSPVRKAWP